MGTLSEPRRLRWLPFELALMALSDRCAYGG